MTTTTPARPPRSIAARPAAQPLGRTACGGAIYATSVGRTRSRRHFARISQVPRQDVRVRLVWARPDRRGGWAITSLQDPASRAVLHAAPRT
ncbi:hypothetical protein GKE82_23680 [Conexibacter sp. W3-3-2]|uniref:hypothetical protein n=1 Tax=Conexibacter sp. W3-3-2 TaxID=2675227 RepID=UPI0012B8CA68|nr:hypothetical protein [Conexibacter sp. W3-3-2]MTD47207.1 hypothetical protein [Conexibacter sp. W3-3-2]